MIHWLKTSLLYTSKVQRCYNGENVGTGCEGCMFQLCFLSWNYFCWLAPLLCWTVLLLDMTGWVPALWHSEQWLFDVEGKCNGTQETHRHHAQGELCFIKATLHFLCADCHRIPPILILSLPLTLNSLCWWTSAVRIGRKLLSSLWTPPPSLVMVASRRPRRSSSSWYVWDAVLARLVVVVMFTSFCYFVSAGQAQERLWEGT